MRVLDEVKVQVAAQPEGQISKTDPDARSMATSGRGSGIVGYNVQVAVDAKHHLIVAHEVTNLGHDRVSLAPVAQAAREAMGKERLRAIADRGYYSALQIKACADTGIAAILGGTSRRWKIVKAPARVTFPPTSAAVNRP